jgi:hypothetical protein
MAKSTLTKYKNTVDVDVDLAQKYQVEIKVGYGVTYSKYNTLMHFLSVLDQYWDNPDLNYIQIFGKDIRNLLVSCC